MQSHRNREAPSVGSMVDEMRHLSRAIDELVSDLRAQAVEAAEKDAAFRAAYSRCLIEEKGGAERITNAEAEARAELQTIDLRVSAKVAEASADATKQALLARRTQLSALQSIAASVREEMAFSRTSSPF